MLKRMIVNGMTIFYLLLFSQLVAAEIHEVEILKFKFIPETITIKVGDTVRWVNKERRQYHSVWFEALGELEPEDYFFPGETFERKFEVAGTFPYRCGPHPKMRATVVVK